MSSQLLLDRRSRFILAAFLLDLERPHKIPPERWLLYCKGTASAMPLVDFLEIADLYGPRIFDALCGDEDRPWADNDSS